MEQTAGNTIITNDQIIKELIELLNKNQQKEAANNVFEMAAYIDGMGQKMDAVLKELVNVRKHLVEMERRQERKTVRETLSGAVKKLEQQCQKMKQQIFEVRTEIKTKAAEIIAETWKKGKAALNKVSEFLGIKNKLQNIRQNVQESIAEVDKIIEKIETFGTGMREAGRKISNTFRIFVNKPEKEYGERKFSKTELLKKPFQAKRKLLIGILNYTDAAIEKMEWLALDVRQQTVDKAEHELERIEEEQISKTAYTNVAGAEYQYGAEAFEEYEKGNMGETIEFLGKEVNKTGVTKSR